MKLFDIPILLLLYSAPVTSRRSFSIDYDKKTFLRNGQSHRYVSGTLHYFRVLPGAWRDRLVKMRLAGADRDKTLDNVVKKSFKIGSCKRKIYLKVSFLDSED